MAATSRTRAGFISVANTHGRKLRTGKANLSQIIVKRVAQGEQMYRHHDPGVREQPKPEGNHCIGTFWTEREVAVIDALSKKQDLSHVATLRQALRNYQLIVEGVPDTGSKLKDETAIPCPKCGQPLKAVEYPSNSPLNRDQWESQLPGDLFCTCHNNHKGNKPYAYFWRSDFEIGIPNVPAMVHQAERFCNAANVHAEEMLPRILELADSECGGEDSQLIYELAKAFRNFAEAEIAWRNAGYTNAKAALGHMLKLVEDGVLVRNTADDGDMTKFVEQSARLARVLTQAQESLARTNITA